MHSCRHFENGKHSAGRNKIQMCAHLEMVLAHVDPESGAPQLLVVSVREGERQPVLVLREIIV